MNPPRESSEDASRLAFEGELTIYTAAESYAKLRDCMVAHDRCALDLSAVSEIDCAGLQCLLWIVQLAEREGKSLTLVARSQVVDEAIALLHLGPAFGIDAFQSEQESHEPR
ncbi:STAS domain-containing protein [Thiorhodococcus fuscus]|uniref:Lipid asymmetry maintenance protein MlaB n=1 Tax=Thiorhodococcus fuscus TaxID=527200 RepID=A0ABW4YBY6_9GAMM